MLAAIVQLVPLAIAAAFSPSGLAVSSALMATGKGRIARVTALILGATAFLTLFVPFLAGTREIMQSFDSRLGDRWSGLFAILAGLSCVGIAAFMLTSGGDKKAEPVSKDARLERLADRRPYELFVLGFGWQVVKVRQNVLMLAAVQIVSSSGSPKVFDIILIVLFLGAVLLPYLAPVIFALLYPERSEAMLERLAAWLHRNGPRIVAVICLPIGVYLLYEGIKAI